MGPAVALALLLLAQAPAAPPAPPAMVATVNSIPPVAGNVTVGTFSTQRQAGVPVNAGVANFSFPQTFMSTPICFASIDGYNASYVYAAPVQAALSTSQVSFNVQAALKVLGISLGATTFWSNAPAGTTLNISCIGQ